MLRKVGKKMHTKCKAPVRSKAGVEWSHKENFYLLHIR